MVRTKLTEGRMMAGIGLGEEGFVEKASESWGRIEMKFQLTANLNTYLPPTFPGGCFFPLSISLFNPGKVVGLVEEVSSL